MGWERVVDDMSDQCSLIQMNFADQVSKAVLRIASEYGIDPDRIRLVIDFDDGQSDPSAMIQFRRE